MKKYIIIKRGSMGEERILSTPGLFISMDSRGIRKEFDGLQEAKEARKRLMKSFPQDYIYIYTKKTYCSIRFIQYLYNLVKRLE